MVHFFIYLENLRIRKFDIFCVLEFHLQILFKTFCFRNGLTSYVRNDCRSTCWFLYNALYVSTFAIGMCRQSVTEAPCVKFSDINSAFLDREIGNRQTDKMKQNKLIRTFLKLAFSKTGRIVQMGVFSWSRLFPVICNFEILTNLYFYIYVTRKVLFILFLTRGVE